MRRCHSKYAATQALRAAPRGSCTATKTRGVYHVIVVPGIFFDLNPSKRRDLFDSPCHHFVRLSYGPRMDTLAKGMDAIERIVKK